MTETIKGIRTNKGLAQIDYSALANTPIIVNYNLLDNWYFINPVNQRGKTEYTASGVFIDRWIRTTGSSCIMSLTADGLKIENNSSSSVYIRQFFEKTIVVKEFVLSVLADDVVGSPTFYLGYDDGTTGGGSTVIDGLSSKTNTFATGKNATRFQLTIPAGASLTIKAVKLEFGNKQTLARQDISDKWILNEVPNYGEQLARCQRQLYVLNSRGKQYCPFGGSDCNNAGYVYIQVPVPTTMRDVPAVTYEGAWRLRSGTYTSITGMSVYALSENMVTLRVEGSGLTVGSFYSLLSYNDSTARIFLSAEITS